jgi:hypothetical protein
LVPAVALVAVVADETVKSPATWSFELGVTVPIPTSPALVMRMRSVVDCRKTIGADVVPEEKNMPLLTPGPASNENVTFPVPLSVRDIIE